MLGNALGAREFWNSPYTYLGLGLALPFSLESCFVYVAQSFKG